MHLGHLEIFVRDPLASKDFYVDVLGFELVTVQGSQFVWLKSGTTEVLLRPGKASTQSETYESTHIALVLYTDDLDKSAESLRAKGLQFKGNDGSPRCLTFTDGDGNWFQLTNPNE